MSEDSPQLVEYDKASIIDAAREDMNLFSNLMLPDVVTKAFPPFYVYLWHMLVNAKSNQDASKVFRFALGLPRNHAKTTFVKLLIVYGVLYGKWKFVLIVAATVDLSENILSDIAGMLKSELVAQLWGSWEEGRIKDTNGTKRSKFLGREVILVALGAGSSLRGLNLDNSRPDLILMDDMQTRENAMSIAERTSLLQWMVSTLLKARDLNSAVLIYVGNLYNEECILNQLRNHPDWTSLITGAILKDQTALWSDLFTVEQLMREYKHDDSMGLGELWFAEVMNLIVGGKSSLLQSSTLPVSPYENDEPIAKFITIDPAGWQTNSDDNVLAVHHLMADEATIITREIKTGRWTPGDVVDLIVDQILNNSVRTIGIETVAYQKSLQWLLERELEHLKLLDQVVIIPLMPGGRSKTLRIITHVHELEAGTCFLHSSVQPMYIMQAAGYRLDRKDNKDDILDDAAYCLDMRSSNRIIRSTVGASLDADSLGVMDDNTFLD